MCSYLSADGGHYSGVGDRYFDEFNTRFWLNPGNNPIINV
jgi:hypothetical protein